MKCNVATVIPPRRFFYAFLSKKLPVPSADKEES